jgi:hypothetical protein
MAVSNAKKVALILGILAAVLGLFLAVHFSGSNALVMLAKCLAMSFTHFAGN